MEFGFGGTDAELDAVHMEEEGTRMEPVGGRLETGRSRVGAEFSRECGADRRESWMVKSKAPTKEAERENREGSKSVRTQSRLKRLGHGYPGDADSMDPHVYEMVLDMRHCGRDELTAVLEKEDPDKKVRAAREKLMRAVPCLLFVSLFCDDEEIWQSNRLVNATCFLS